MKSKIALLIKAVVLLAIMVLMVIGTMFDLSISKLLADIDKGEYFSNNHFANALEGAGELPTFILLGASLAVFGYVLAQKRDTLKVFVLIVFAVVCVGILSYGLIRCVESFAEIYGFADKIRWAGDELCCVLLAIAITAGFVLIGKRLGKENILKLYYFALSVIIVCGVSFVLTQGLKMLFSRPRFRTLHLIDKFELFAPWYKVNPFKDVPKSFMAIGVAEDGYSSFPSGHTSWACCLIMLAYLPTFVPNIGKKSKIWLRVIPSVLIPVIAFSRIIAGAHFLTDVAFSMLFTLILADITVLILKRKHRKIYPFITIEEDNI